LHAPELNPRSAAELLNEPEVRASRVVMKPGVALFLPFRCTKAQQMAASGGTKRRSKSADYTRDEARSGDAEHVAA
jgi:hypothetical protein